MRIHRFEADTVTRAIEKVRSALGPDAVILHTQTIRKGGWFGLGGRRVTEVIAATDLNTVQRLAAAPPAPNRRPPPPRPARAAPSQPLAAAAAPSAPAGAAEARGGKILPGPGSNGHAQSLEQEIQQLQSLITRLLRREEDRSRPAIAPELSGSYDRLCQGEVGANLAEALVRRLENDLAPARRSDGGLVRARLRLYISHLIGRCSPIALRPGRPTRIAFVGPTGVGKTTTLAKIAANFKLREGKRVGLLTADTYRIAAVDQLTRYANLLSLPVRTVLAPADVQRALQDFTDCDLVLMDTAGRSHRNEGRMEELARIVAALEPDETHLVLSVTTRPSHVIPVIRRFDAMRVDRLIFTKLDEAASFGMILSVVAGLGKSLSYLTTGQEVPDDIEIGHADRIARLILGEEAA